MSHISASSRRLSLIDRYLALPIKMPGLIGLVNVSLGMGRRNFQTAD
jgi:hypothetical protein